MIQLFTRWHPHDGFGRRCREGAQLLYNAAQIVGTMLAIDDEPVKTSRTGNLSGNRLAHIEPKPDLWFTPVDSVLEAVLKGRHGSPHVKSNFRSAVWSSSTARFGRAPASSSFLPVDVGLGIIDGIHGDEAALPEIPDRVAAFSLTPGAALFRHNLR